MSTQIVKDSITAVIRKNIDDANAYYNLNLPMPKVDFSLRGTCAGKAKLREWIVRVNQVLLDENEDEMVNVTIPHEVAHLVDFRINPENFQSKRLTGRKRSIHGPTFKHILGNVLGCHDTSTTHNGYY